MADLYSQLSGSKDYHGITYLPTGDFFDAAIKKRLTKAAIAKKSDTAINTVYQVFKTKTVCKASAEKISKVVGLCFSKAFTRSKEQPVLSNRTILHHHMLISTVLNKAVEWEVIKENKARLIKPPKVKPQEIAFLDETQVQSLVRELHKAPVQEAMMIKLFLLTGMRRGEMCGLEWKDIDFDKKTLSICRASQYLAEKGVFTKEPKTATSKRSMPISKTTAEILKNYKAWQDDKKLRVGDDWNPLDRLFTTADGKPIFRTRLQAGLVSFKSVWACQTSRSMGSGIHILRCLFPRAWTL